VIDLIKRIAIQLHALFQALQTGDPAMEQSASKLRARISEQSFHHGTSLQMWGINDERCWVESLMKFVCG
jgi:hypothetical protein